MPQNPLIFEINTRVWIKRFPNSGVDRFLLNNVPDEYWQNLADLGFHYVWLMGLWKTNPAVIDKYCFEEGLVKEYSKAVKDWQRHDIIGSPYAIDRYEINPDFGNSRLLKALKIRLNNFSLKLILDFVPNHFSAESSLIKSNPEIFLSVAEEFLERDSHTYFRPENNKNIVFAHGRDPFFPAWQDTIQVNYYSESARTFMTDTLLSLTELCDGVRCDMAMLALNNVFHNTWGAALDAGGFIVPGEEFWENALKTVKVKNPDFLFIAEAYWDLEYKLQTIGFDYTYDKKLTDRLKDNNVASIRDHLRAEFSYQEKSLRFIENHDEQRSAEILGKNKARAASVVVSTIRGMKFIYDGQMDGVRIKLPVQMGAEPKYQTSKCINDHYTKLLSIIKSEIFQIGKWTLHEPFPAWEGNNSYRNLLSWSWEYENERRLVVVNYSDSIAQGRIRCEVGGFPEKIYLTDLLNGQVYHRYSAEMAYPGIFIELQNFQSHIFSFGF